MARYTGPKVKISRRLGVNIFENEKGSKALNKRPYPPGEHGRSRRRQPSEYLLQLPVICHHFLFFHLQSSVDKLDLCADPLRADALCKRFDERFKVAAGDIHGCAVFAVFHQPGNNIFAAMNPEIFLHHPLRGVTDLFRCGVLDIGQAVDH